MLIGSALRGSRSWKRKGVRQHRDRDLRGGRDGACGLMAARIGVITFPGSLTHLGFVHAAVVSVSAGDDGYVERRDSQRIGERPEEQEVVLHCAGGGDSTEIDLPVWCPPEVCQQL